MLVPSPISCTAPESAGQSPQLNSSQRRKLTWEHQAIQWNGTSQCGHNQAIIPSKEALEHSSLDHTQDDHDEGQHTQDAGENGRDPRLSRFRHLAGRQGKVGSACQNQWVSLHRKGGGVSLRSPRPSLTPHFMMVHPVACVKNVLSMQRQVTFDAAQADCATTSEKHLNWYLHMSLRNG